MKLVSNRWRGLSALVLLAMPLATQAEPIAPPVTPASKDATPVAASPVAAKAAPAVAEIVQFYMQDGSVLHGKMLLKEIVVATEFGTLHVPVNHIRSFVPGLTSRTALQKKIAELIEKLGDSDKATRTAASKRLLKLGIPVEAELRRHASDKNAARVAEIKKLLTALEKKSTELQLQGDLDATPHVWRREDTIVTNDFTALGIISPKTFQIGSKFGTMTVQLADISRVQRQGNQSTTLRKSLGVSGQYIVQRSFKSASIRVQRGDRISITASGTMQMSPWGSSAMSTPEGSTTWGTYSAGSGGIPVGALVAKIGNGGTVFKVGSKHTSTAKASGLLRFAVAMHPSYASNSFPGEYKLKVRVERGQQ